MFVSTKKIWEDFTREVTIEHSLGRNSRILVDCLFKLFGRLFKNHQGFPGGSVVKKKKKERKKKIHLPRQETRVQSLFRENSTCHGAAKPLHHNY